jgi:hypothetical protein
MYLRVAVNNLGGGGWWWEGASAVLINPWDKSTQSIMDPITMFKIFSDTR